MPLIKIFFCTMKTRNSTGRGQLRFGNLNDQIWVDCTVSGTCTHGPSILSLHSLIRKQFYVVKHAEIPKCFVPVSSDTCLLRESYNGQELAVLKPITCRNPKQRNGSLLFIPAPALLGRSPEHPRAQLEQTPPCLPAHGSQALQAPSLRSPQRALCSPG